MSDSRGEQRGEPVLEVVGIQCEAYPDDCQFAMQAGVFETDSGGSLFPSMTDRETCPSCGGGVENWEPPFEGAAPGRPTEW